MKSRKTKAAVIDFLSSRRARGLSRETINWYGQLLAPFSRCCPLLPAAAAPLEHYLGGLDVGDETRHAHFRALRALYGWLYPRRDNANPMLDIAAPKRRRKVPYSLTLTEMGFLLAVPLSQRDRALVELLLDTGVRISEALGLVIDDVLDETIIVSGKTGQREVPISAGVKENLLKLSKGAGSLFTGRQGRLTRSGAHRIVRLALAAAGIPARKCGPHVLRHTFGRQYIMAGGDLVSLQRILGHTDIQTTRIYAELDLRDITIQHHRFTPLKAYLDAVGGLTAVLPRGGKMV